MRPFLALDPVAPRSSRYLSLLAGVAVFFPFLRLARRLAPPRYAPLAALALAVSPLHIQASITASSEALYLLLMVLCLERLLAALDSGSAATFALAGLFASLAAVTRYDAWIDFPIVVAAAWLWRARGIAGRWRGLVIFAAVAASLPAAWIAWSARVTDDPFFFAHYISNDHAQLAAAITARWGALGARLRQVGIWSLAFVGDDEPAAARRRGDGARRWFQARRAAAVGAAKIVAVAALAPPALYLAQGTVAAELRAAAALRADPGRAAAAARRRGGGQPLVRARLPRRASSPAPRSSARSCS